MLSRIDKNAVVKGYCKSDNDFDFRECYSDKFMTWAKGREREKRSRELFSRQDKSLACRILPVFLETMEKIVITKNGHRTRAGLLCACIPKIR